jgi:hypothetical protein
MATMTKPFDTAADFLAHGWIGAGNTNSTL